MTDVVVADDAGTHALRDEDADAQEMVIASLRAQVSDLFTQVSQLNGKLVSSYDRISGLEDELHEESTRLRNTSLKVSQLELERTQHLSDLSAGLLVEKSQVTTELNRLMERATDEAARRGQAESARAAIEKELGELSASLFEQANRMVRDANLLRAQSERRANEAEDALRTAEEAVGGMQIQMQSLRSDKDRTDTEMLELRALVDKGKWVERPQQGASPSQPLNLISSHVPYEEFLFFVAHLRGLRPQPVPAMSTLLSLPFLARLVTEDSDPTLRLDLAPALNWLSRRAVSAAVHAGALNIEPITTGAFLRETSTMVTLAAVSSIVCALCGKPVQAKPSTQPKLEHRPSNSGTWNLPKPTSAPSTSATPILPARPSSRTTNPIYQAQIYVFRVTPASAPGAPTPKSTTYALCGTGWCLPRLRATCELWHFIRTRVVERVWEEEMPATLSAPATPGKPPRSNSGTITGFAGAIAGSIVNGVNNVSGARKSSQEPSAGPVRRSSAGRVGSLLGMVGMAGSKAPTPSTTTSRTSNAQLTPTREKPSLTARSPSSQTTRSPTGTVASRRRASNASNTSIKSPVRSPPPPPPRRLVQEKRVGQEQEQEQEQEIEHHIDEHGPPAEVLFELDAGSPTTKEAPVLRPPALPPRARPVSASVVPLPMSPPTTPEPGAKPAPPSVPIVPKETGRASPALNGTGRASPALNASGRNSPSAPPVPKRAAGRKRAATIMRDPPQTPPPSEKKPETVIQEEAEEPTPGSDITTEKVIETVSEMETVPAKADEPAVLGPISEAVPNSVTVEAASDPTPIPVESETKDEPAIEESSVTYRDIATPSPATDAPTEVTLVNPDILTHSTPTIEIPLSSDLVHTAVASVQGISVDSLAVPIPSSPGVESPLLAASPLYEREPEPAPIPEAVKEDLQAPASELDSGAQYVGETTWEERSWKEIVTLREKMFWARIGCVR